MKSKADSFVVNLHSCLRFCGGVFMALVLVVSAASARATTYTLGTTALLEGPTAGGDSVVLGVSPETGTWTATANPAWLHLGFTSHNGTGSASVIFSFDANPGLTRTGTVTIAGQTLTVTQAGSSYIAAPGPVTTLATLGLTSLCGMAVDDAGSVYICDGGANAIRKWLAASNTLITLVSSGLNFPHDVAVDGAGNVYIADTQNNAIKIWNAAGNSLSTLVSSGLNQPYGVAVDSAGNVYIADFGNSAIKKWTAQSGVVSTLISSGLSYPSDVVVDGVGNLYIADSGNSAVKKWTAAQSTVSTIGTSGMWSPKGVAVDGGGNVYVSDYYNNAVKKWTVATYGGITTLFSAGLSNPFGVAVDGAGNVYVTDYGHSTVKEMPRAFVDPTTKSEGAGAGSDVLPVVLPVTANLLAPFTPVSSQPWLTISGITNGVVSFSFTANSGADRTANITLLGQIIPVTQRTVPFSLGSTALLEGPTAGTDSVALTVIPETVTWTATSNDSWLHLSVANQGGTGSKNVAFTFDFNPGATRTGTLTIAGQTLTVTQQGSSFSLDSTAFLEGPAAGNASVVLIVSPEIAPWAATANATWLHLSFANQSGTGSANVVFTFDVNPGATRTGTLTIAGQTLTVTQQGTYSLGTAALLGGPTASTDSVVLAVCPETASWTATANTSWLHLSVANQNGTGSTNVIFSYDPNPGATRTGTLTVGNQTLTVTQAGSRYIAAPVPATTLASGLSYPTGTAVDSQGNVYIADPVNNTIKKWTAADNTVTPLISSGLKQPYGVAVDSVGSVYIAEYYYDAGFVMHSAIMKWTAANSTLTTLVSSGLNGASAVAVDGAGNVYIADPYGSAIKKWTAANNTLTTLVSSGIFANGLAVDGAGNVYIADYSNNAVKKWTAANGSLSTLISSGLNKPYGLAVDGAGNLYIANEGNNTVQKWTPANNTVTTLISSGLSYPDGVAVDGLGNIYIADSHNGRVKELPHLYVDLTAKSESLAAGSDVLPAVLPATANLLFPFAPISDQSWLSIGGITNGVISFTFTAAFSDRSANIYLLGQNIPVPVTQSVQSFSLITNQLSEGPVAGNDSVVLTVSPATASWTATANDSWVHLSVTNQSGLGSTSVVFSFDTNPGFTRTGVLTIAGQTLTVTQFGLMNSLGTTALLEGPTAGSDSVVLAMSPPTASWTATTNASWLHLSVPNQSGNGGTNVIFSYDANPGSTRTGTLTIAGQILTITQAGSTYVAAPTLVTTLVSSELSLPEGVAVDGAGNVYIADTPHSTIKKWTATNNTVTTLVSSGLLNPRGLAIDCAANLYFSVDSWNGSSWGGAIKKWTATNNTVTLVSSELSSPSGVAVDGGGNVYFSDWSGNTIKKWTAANNAVTTLVSSGLKHPSGVALDGLGNVYIVDDDNFAIKKWTAANGTVTTLISGLNELCGVAVDGAGNVYTFDFYNSAIVKWTAANRTVTTLVAADLLFPGGFAVDGAGNLFIADTYNNAIKELPRAFVDPTSKLESSAAGNDVLLTVLPTTANLLTPFAPTSDQSWLTISGFTNGVVSFAFSATISNRTAHINLLGQTVPITQAAPTNTAPVISQLSISSLSLSGTNLVISGTSTGWGTFYVLTSTNVAKPLRQWQPVATNVLSASGNFILTATNVVKRNIAQQFFALSTTNNPSTLSSISSLVISHLSLSGTNAIIAGTNAGAGTCYVLTSTNLSKPLPQWQPVATNLLNGSGSFIITATNAVGGNGPQQFFILTTALNGN